MNKLIITAALLLVCGGVGAQSVPSPAPAQTKPIVLRNGILHPGDGKPAFQGDVLITGGKISGLGAANVPADALVMDLAGQHVYPGLIAPCTQLGIEEVEAVRSTSDVTEAGPINPNMRTLIAYNTDSRVTPTVRSNGILLAQVSPDGPLFAGSSSVMQLDAWTWEQAAYQADDAIHLFWPSMNLSTHRFAPPLDEQKKRLTEALAQITQALDDARAYRAAKLAGSLEQHDQRWEALIPVIEQRKSIWVHASTERQIRAVLAFMVEQDLKIVLVGGEDAWLMAEQLKAQQVPVVLHSSHSLPRSEDDDVDQPYKTARLLHQAGVLVALHNEGFWQQRNLPFLAGTLVAHGIDPEVALQMITANPAKILGIDARTGSLELGKDANIIVSKGDVLDMRSSDIVWACIQGRAIDLGNHHKELYKKFQVR